MLVMLQGYRVRGSCLGVDPWSEVEVAALPTHMLIQEGFRNKDIDLPFSMSFLFVFVFRDRASLV